MEGHVMHSSSERSFLCRFLRIASEAVLLFIIYKYLSNTFSLVFAAAGFAAAVTAGFLLERSGLRMIWAASAAVGAAFLIRLITFAATGLIASSSDVPLLDFQFFLFDSGFFPLFVPLLYITMMNFLSQRKTCAVPVEVILNGVIFASLMWSQGGYNIDLFSHPGILALFSFIFIMLEIFILITNGFYLKKMNQDRRGILLFVVIIIPVLLLILFLFFGRYSEGAAKEGGGLMKPTLLRFDFSDYVKLESEISMSSDLVLLLRNRGYLNSVYLRRFYLSGYRPERGFYIEQGPGEGPQYMAVPQQPAETGVQRFPHRIESEQEYFIKNFDPSALIAMNYPIEVFPLTNWNGSSFLRNYRVISESVELPSWELSDAPMLALDDALYEFYTEYGDDSKIQELALEVTEGLDSYYDKVIAIMFYLKDRYFYSLKPGVAVDGNQLSHFLFESRKGYCSYFAFSMTLMCRSIGIPARVAAGFFIDPESGILDVYPVRADMAHAWVEVPFEGFGWVEFDPTSDQIALGEDFEFAPLDSSEYADLVEEVISNDYSIELNTEKSGTENRDASVLSLLKDAGRALLRFWYFILPAIYIMFTAAYHVFGPLSVMFSSRRGKIRGYYNRMVRVAVSFGFRRKRGESILEYALRLEADFAAGAEVLAECYLESVFATDCPDGVLLRARAGWRLFKENCHGRPAGGRVLRFLFPLPGFRVKSFIRSGSTVFLLALLIFCGAIPAEAQDTDSGSDADSTWYIEASAREQDSENYSTALKLLNEGITMFPNNWELKKAAGDLYADRELYNLAVEQYKKALSLSADNTEIIYSKSVAEGLLNLDEDSITSLERLLELEPDNFNGIADLGWMYFKTYRLDEAEQLLLAAIEQNANSPIFSMTLGTVYSGKYDYENAQKYYLEAINMALEKGWDYFASVSYYNLSLLEHGFYKYKKALEYTDKSIETGERAPGYIARAELYLGRLDFDSAFQNYQQAYVLDSTPLALMGLADLYLNFGLLDEALSHIEEVRKRDDDSWMYYFGIDPGRHEMEVDRLLSEIYSGFVEREHKNPVFGLRRAVSIAESLKYRCLQWYYDRRFRKASFDVGISNREEGNSLDSAWAFYVANEDYSGSAVKYLRRAEMIEVEAAPEAKASYLLEKGKLAGDAAMLEQALKLLDPEWERLSAAEALAELAVLYEKKGEDVLSARAAEELFSINPGVFIREGLSFPLIIDPGCGWVLRSALRRGGFDILVNNPDISYRYKLSVADNEGEVILYSVQDLKTETVLTTIPVTGGLNSPYKASAFTAEINIRLFEITDGKDGSL
jgi:tetratricopeptide (TPR) repeat protein